MFAQVASFGKETSCWRYSKRWSVRNRALDFSSALLNTYIYRDEAATSKAGSTLPYVSLREPHFKHMAWDGLLPEPPADGRPAELGAPSNLVCLRRFGVVLRAAASSAADASERVMASSSSCSWIRSMERVMCASTAASRASSGPTTMDAASGGCCFSRWRVSEQRTGERLEEWRMGVSRNFCWDGRLPRPHLRRARGVLMAWDDLEHA